MYLLLHSIVAVLEIFRHDVTQSMSNLLPAAIRKKITIKQQNGTKTATCVANSCFFLSVLRWILLPLCGLTDVFFMQLSTPLPRHVPP